MRQVTVENSPLLCISVVIESVVIGSPSVSVIAINGFFFDLDAASEVVCSAFFPAALGSLLPPPLAASGPRRPPGRLFAVAASVAVTPGSAVTFAGARAAAFAILRTRPKQKRTQNNELVWDLHQAYFLAIFSSGPTYEYAENLSFFLEF